MKHLLTFSIGSQNSAEESADNENNTWLKTDKMTQTHTLAPSIYSYTVSICYVTVYGTIHDKSQKPGNRN